jgi:PAS domain S-box-containing protein
MTLIALQRVFDATATPVFVRDAEAYIIYHNKAAAELLGYSQAELAQKHITDLFAADPRLVLSGLEQVKKQGHWSGRVLYRLKNGGLLKADVNVFARILSDGTWVNVSFVHGLPEHAANFALAADPEIQFGLTAGQVALLQLLAEGLSDQEWPECSIPLARRWASKWLSSCNRCRFIEDRSRRVGDQIARGPLKAKLAGRA